jgi:hypothetical protein
MEGSMQDNVIVARQWTRDAARTRSHDDAAAWRRSLECAGLVSLLGLLLTAIFLFGSSPGAVEAFTAAMM